MCPPGPLDDSSRDVASLRFILVTVFTAASEMREARITQGDVSIPVPCSRIADIIDRAEQLADEVIKRYGAPHF